MTLRASTQQRRLAANQAHIKPRVKKGHKQGKEGVQNNTTAGISTLRTFTCLCAPLASSYGYTEGTYTVVVVVVYPNCRALYVRRHRTLEILVSGELMFNRRREAQLRVSSTASTFMCSFRTWPRGKTGPNTLHYLGEKQTRGKKHNHKIKTTQVVSYDTNIIRLVR